MKQITVSMIVSASILVTQATDAVYSATQQYQSIVDSCFVPELNMYNFEPQQRGLRGSRQITSLRGVEFQPCRRMDFHDVRGLTDQLMSTQFPSSLTDLLFHGAGLDWNTFFGLLTSKRLEKLENLMVSGWNPNLDTAPPMPDSPITLHLTLLQMDWVAFRHLIPLLKQRLIIPDMELLFIMCPPDSEKGWDEEVVSALTGHGLGFSCNNVNHYHKEILFSCGFTPSRQLFDPDRPFSSVSHRRNQLEWDRRNKHADSFDRRFVITSLERILEPLTERLVLSGESLWVPSLRCLQFPDGIMALELRNMDMTWDVFFGLFTFMHFPNLRQLDVTNNQGLLLYIDEFPQGVSIVHEKIESLSIDYAALVTLECFLDLIDTANIRFPCMTRVMVRFTTEEVEQIRNERWIRNLVMPLFKDEASFTLNPCITRDNVNMVIASKC